MLANTHSEGLCIAATTGSKSQLKKTTTKNREVFTNTIRTVNHQLNILCEASLAATKRQRDAAYVFMALSHGVDCQRKTYSQADPSISRVFFFVNAWKQKFNCYPSGFFSSHTKNFPVKITLTLRLRVRFSRHVAVDVFFFYFPSRKKADETLSDRKYWSLFFFSSAMWLWNKSTFRHLLMGKSRQTGQQGAIRASYTPGVAFLGIISTHCDRNMICVWQKKKNLP